jgi:hypothetical protein
MVLPPFIVKGGKNWQASFLGCLMSLTDGGVAKTSDGWLCTYRRSVSHKGSTLRA